MKDYLIIATDRLVRKLFVCLEASVLWLVLKNVLLSLQNDILLFYSNNLYKIYSALSGREPDGMFVLCNIQLFLIYHFLMPQNIFCSILRFVQIQFLMSFRLYKLEEQVVKREKHKTIFLFEYNLSVLVVKKQAR